MRQETSKVLLSVIDEVSVRLTNTKKMVAGVYSDLDAQNYANKVDRVLVEVDKARVFLLRTATEVDGKS